VRVLCRRPERLDPGVAGRVEIVQGDIRDAAPIGAAVRGARIVLHLAACARAWSRDPNEFRDVNVRATRRLLAAAREAGVERLVHVSTLLTLPPYRPAPLRDGALEPTPYEATKRAGERLVEDYAAAGLDAVIVHPTRVYGPGPLNDANGVTRMIGLYVAGRFRVRLADRDVLANYVHAADVAAGIVRAGERGRAGVHYVLGGAENVSLREFLEIVAELSGRRYRTVALPPSAALAVARAAELWARLGGGTSITTGWVRVFLEDRRVDITASREELGYRPRPLRAGVAETLRWLCGDGG
jgi:farnesol dehydrogenase